MASRARIRTAATWAATATCLLVVVLYVVSIPCWAQWSARSVGANGYNELDVSAANGAIIVTRTRFHPAPPGSSAGWTLDLTRSEGALIWVPRREASATVNSRGLAWTLDRVSFPLWIAVLPCLAATVLLWRPDVIRRVRARRGRCIACGYDRRSLPLESPCPECGSPPRAKVATQVSG